MADTGQLIIAVGVGISLSACCGFRVFLPLLISSIAMKMGWLPAESQMAWMGDWPAILCFGVASVVEIGAYYIPVVDNVLDALATPLAIGAGTLMAASFLPVGDLDPLLKWGLGLVAGGGVAGTIHLGTGGLRLLSTKTTAGAGNAVVATGEHLAAVLGSLLALVIPVLVAILSLILVIFIAYRLFLRPKA